MTHQTKIVATIGPASRSPDMIDAFLSVGVNVFRLNFSHGSAEDHLNAAALIREKANKINRHVAIMADLQGPKIRIGEMPNGQVDLVAGAQVIIDVSQGFKCIDNQVISCNYKPLPEQVCSGDILLLDDGFIQLSVESVEGERVYCVVTVGGMLKTNKGINKLGGGLSAPSLTEKDKKDILTAAKLGADYVAVSFVSSAEDMNTARKLAQEAGFEPGLVAKIERAELSANLALLDEVIQASDGVMVARGDLGVEIGDAALISMQKHIIYRSRELGRFVITATQMMESMVKQPAPTRAEVMDVANAVLDGTDAVMLSAESAAGDYPLQAVQTISKVCQGAELQPLQFSRALGEIGDTRTDSFIARYAISAANSVPGVSAIVALTETGKTALLMSRYNTGIPIFAFCRHKKTLQKMAPYRWVSALKSGDDWGMNDVDSPIEVLKAQNIVKSGDRLIVTFGDVANQSGGTNNLKIVSID